MYHDNFELMLANSWVRDGRVVLDINNFLSKVKEWNFSSFGHISGKKRLLLARLKEIKKKLDQYPLEFLLNLKKQLSLDLKEVLSQKASLWQQKIPCKWASPLIGGGRIV
ncbi:hypothetical protein ES332_D01G166000v1 [Gossypium tomentosum]|uniref:Uncharacterized protein n=1 Tax=Gossypium tomentosum TaxID=34277 RepID=A0A5D2M9Y5_GOSTO|nr:hypothetical protein ES332_D01G166000v1 [Gossypium tomentosum]